MHVEQVAHDRARQHPDRAGAGALNQAEGEQRADGGRKSGAEAAQGEERQPDDQHGLAAEAVGERADDERRGRESGEKNRDRRGGRCLARAQIRLDEGQARQRHVDRQRRQRRHGREKDHERAAMDVERHQGNSENIVV